MDPALYPRMAEVEDVHWWFASRRAIVEAMIGQLGLPAHAEILEPGCGTGGNLRMLARHGSVYAMDSESLALGYAGALGCAEVRPGRLPDQIPFEDRCFDLIVMTDVLEHLDRDLESLSALRERLKPGGFLLLTVPAWQWMWSRHDLTHHHLRRYTRRDLGAALVTAGYAITYLSYYNFVLFPVIALARLAERLAPKEAENGELLKLPPAPLNRMLTTIFSSERHLLRHMRLPVGVSLLAIARN